jgi:hypothetical protein
LWEFSTKTLPVLKVSIYRYKQARRQTKLSLGACPTVTRAMRRKARDEAEKRAGGIVLAAPAARNRSAIGWLASTR